MEREITIKFTEEEYETLLALADFLNIKEPDTTIYFIVCPWLKAMQFKMTENEVNLEIHYPDFQLY